MCYWEGIEKVPTEEDWVSHRVLLTGLNAYHGMTTAQIRQYMKENHGLIASETMYRNRLDRWNQSKQERSVKLRGLAKRSIRSSSGNSHTASHFRSTSEAYSSENAEDVGSSQSSKSRQRRTQQSRLPTDGNVRNQQAHRSTVSDSDVRRRRVQVFSSSDPQRPPSAGPDERYVNSVVKKLDTLYCEYSGTLAISSTWCLCCSSARHSKRPKVCTSDTLGHLSLRTLASLCLLRHPDPGTPMLSFLRKFGADIAKCLQNPGPWLVPRLPILAVNLKAILSAWEACVATSPVATTIVNALRATRAYVVRAMTERVGASHPLAAFCAAVFTSDRAREVMSHSLQQYAKAVETWYEGDSTILERFASNSRLALVAQAHGAPAESERMLLQGIDSMRHNMAVVDEAARSQSLSWLYWIVADACVRQGNPKKAEEAYMASMHNTFRVFASGAASPSKSSSPAPSPPSPPSSSSSSSSSKSSTSSTISETLPGRMSCHYGTRGIVLLYHKQGAWRQCETASRLAVRTYSALFGGSDLRTLEMVYVLGHCMKQQGREAESQALMREWASEFADAG